MGDVTKIEWADSTANLWIGCQKVSPGCDHCYAETLCGARLNQDWGPHADRTYVKAGWATIRKMQRRAARNGGIDPDLGRKRRIFVNSLADTFDNHKSIVWRADFFALAEESPDVILMLVTKRPENVRKMVPAHWMNGFWPEHVWLLVSTEDQPAAERRLPILKDIPAPVRGISAEPLLGPIDIRLLAYSDCPNWLDEDGNPPRIQRDCGAQECCSKCDFTGISDEAFLGWAIVGGESGKGARDNGFEENARGILEQCADIGIPFFGKQNVKKAPLPDDLMVRQFPG